MLYHHFSELYHKERDKEVLLDTSMKARQEVNTGETKYKEHPKKHIHILNAYISHANNYGILYFTGTGVECY
jgi:phage tail tube protein FII